MRQLRKTLKGLFLSAALCSAFAFGVACKDKEEDITLKFNVNGGASISDVTAQKGESVTLPTPQREGYKFDGWYLNEAFDGLPVDSVVVDGSVTYYAKWTKLGVITLDLNGGALSTTTVYAENGSSVYEAVKDYAPTKEGFIFGAWFNDGKELNKNTKLTEAGITLTAGYKVEYTVTVYVQNIEDDEYTMSEEFSYVGADYEGVKVTIDKEIEGCTQIEKEGAIVSGALSSIAADNQFSVYYDRNVYKVVVTSIAPDGSENGYYEEDAKYGATIEIPFEKFNYFIEGYCMLGWSTSIDSKQIDYKANLDFLLHNKMENDEETEGDEKPTSQKIEVLRPTKYYGVWQKGATDLFGGNDYIYTLEGEEDVVYLVRGDVFFKGEYDSETKEFTFYDYLEDDSTQYIVGGKLLDGGKFLYNNPERAGAAVLYKYYEINPVDRVDMNVKIRYDALNGITYTVYENAEAGSIIEESTGTYESIALGEYKATFTEGPMAGQTIHFLIGTLTAGDLVMDGFLVRNDEEYNLGKLYLSGVVDNGVSYSIAQTEVVYVELNGYGQATYVMEDQKAVFNYLKDENGSYNLTDANGKSAGVIRLTSDLNLPTQHNGYFLYDETCDKTFKLENGATLTLDGVCTATYQKDGKTITSYYMLETSAMGGSIISILDGNTTHKFVVRLAEDLITYEAKEVPSTYAEYYYKNEANIYYTPMLVLDETEVGKASVYGMTSSKVFVKAAEGTYEEIEGDYEGMYKFTVTERFDAQSAVKDPLDLSTLQSFVFAKNDILLEYDVHYWFSHGDKDNCEEYKELNGTGTLTLVGGFAYYKALETMKPTLGVFTAGLGYIAFVDPLGDTIYFELNSATMTYQKMDNPPFIAYLLQSNNYTNNEEYFNFDGKGGAIYYYKASEEKDAEQLTATGTATATNEKTAFGSTVYLFKSEDGKISFKYIIAYLSEKPYFLKQEARYYNAEFKDQNDITSSLQLDGYCSQAVYKLSGKPMEGNYYVTDEGVIVFLNKERTLQFTFDVQSDGWMTTRGQEENVYVFYENSYSTSVYCEMDGYGNLSVFTLVKNEEGEYERNYSTKDGKYEKDGDYFILTYEKEGKIVSYTFENRKRAYYSIDGNPYIILMRQQEMDKKVLIDTTDWAVLILDDFNNAIKYDAMGQRQEGNYTIITDNLLYFINKDGTDACIYDYNMETGAASPVELKASTYYTTDLQSLAFSKYGYVIINGDIENPAFFTMEGKNTIVYRAIEEGEDLGGKEVSEYGFVKENFGELDATEEYKGLTYYKSKGSDIKFNRIETDLDLYPIVLGDETWKVTSIQFTPGGGLEFSVNGVADISYTRVDPETSQVSGGERTVNCTVGRELDAEGNAKLFVVLEGYFRLYINATYTGSNDDDANNTYVAEDLKYYQYLYSTMFLDEYYRAYSRYGAARANALENEYGYIALNVDFNEQGEDVEYYVSGEFGEKAKLYDTNGEPLTKIENAKWLSIGSVSYASFTMDDGYEYRLYFGQSQHPYLGIVGYYVHAFVRVQKFEVQDGYTVEVGKTLATDIMGIPLDDVFFMSVTKKNVETGAEELDIDDKYVIDTSRKVLYKIGDVWYCADREYFEDPEYALSANYYLITVEENEGTTVGEGDDEKQIYSTYKSVTLQVVKTKILRAGEVRRYVEIIEVESEAGEKESKVAIIFLHGNVYIVKECTYDEATQTYTVTTEENRTFTVKIVNETTVEIQEV